MTKPSQKSLKDQNQPKLWFCFAMNVAVFYAASRYNVIALSGFKEIVSYTTGFLPIGLGFLVTSILNGLLSAKMKERLVFLRWMHALPGHRAFSVHAQTDPRIDVNQLRKLLSNKLPNTPEEENRTWYRLYKQVEADTSILHIHKEFLLARDYTGFSALFLIVFGTIALLTIRPWSVSIIYLSLLLFQVVFVRQAAVTYGERFVCTVLALQSIKPKRSQNKPHEN